MKNKIYSIFLVGSFIFSIVPVVAFADCGTAAHYVQVTTSNGTVTDECQCVDGATGSYSDGNCACPTGKVWDSGTGRCISTGGGNPSCSACTAVGVDCDSNGQCICPTGQAWTGSSCYTCGVDVPGEGAFCGSGCAGYGGCSGDNGNGGGGNGGGGGGGGGSTPTGSTGITNPINATTFAELVDMVIRWILNIAMVLAPLVIVYGGFTYITAAGDTSKMNQAKQIILYAVIGFILALLAWSLVGIFKQLVV